MFRLLPYLKDYRKECILGPLFKLLEAIFELLLPTLMVLMVNNGVGGRDRGYVWTVGAVMVGMTLLGCASAFICQYFAARASQGFGTALRRDVFGHICSLSLRQMEKFGSETLTNRLTNDVTTLQLGIAMAIRLLVRAPFICGGAIVMALFLNTRLALILVAAAPVFAVLLVWFTRISTPLYRGYQKGLDHLAAVTRENLSGVRVIRAFAMSRREKKRFDASNDDLTATALRLGRISALLNPLTTLVMNAAILLVLWFGGQMVGAGTLEKGEIIAFVNYITSMLLAMVALSNLIILFTKCAASGRRVFRLLAVQPEMDEPAQDAQPPAGETPAIAFDHVTFGFGGEPALRDLTFDVPAGRTLGVIGGTGAGKSTLAALLARFYDVSQGEVRVFGIPVNQLTDETLRCRVAIAPQKTVLFTGSIAQNIRIGRPEADDNAVRGAVRIAQADEFVARLPKAYGAPVERGGLNFSGGQRQRLGVARAVLEDADILILDDASSALDYSTDARMRAALREARRGRTTVIISQRAAAIRDADVILVLDNGRAVGIGTHAQLKESCATYRDILATQA